MSYIIDINDIKEVMHHSNGECCGFYGFKIDESEGLRSLLGFKEHQMSQADYFLILPELHKVQFIEFTALTNDIRDCLIADYILEEDLDSYANLLKKKPHKAKKIVQKKIWSEVLSEFKNKWMGSIAILERYCRHSNITGYLDYKMLIVLDSTTDAKEIEILKDNISDKLIGMVGELHICNSDTVIDSLLVKLPQPSLLLINLNMNISYLENPFSLSSLQFLKLSSVDFDL